MRAAALAGLTALTLLGTSAPVQAQAPRPGVTHDEQITFQEFSRFPDWRTGTHQGTRAVPGRHPALTIARPVGTTEFTDEHTGTTRTWGTPPGPHPSGGSASTPPRWSRRGTPPPRPAPGSRSSCTARTTPGHRPLVRHGPLGLR
ncbi:hypothetical protein V2I01_15735 [Micromonospora sp. BRA006-A]|nr:hypothetical protein [Micromonospora sp. BRA006-A]